MAQPVINLQDLKPQPGPPMPMAPALREPQAEVGEVIYEAPALTSALPRRPSVLRSLGSTMLDGLNFISTYILINFTSLIAFLLFRVFNRTKVRNRGNFGLSKNTLICSNHRTMIDSYMLGHLSSWPWGWLLPRVMPYHPAAAENFFRNKVLGWFSARWRCIPVRRRVKDFNALGMMTEAVPKGQMLIFPEGTRSRTGELGEGRPGTGKLIHDTRCKVVPVYHRGMHRLLPIGASFPRFFKRLDVYVGKPIDMSDLFALPSSKETSKLVIGRVMEALKVLEAQADADEAARAARLPLTAALFRALRRFRFLPTRR